MTYIVCHFYQNTVRHLTRQLHKCVLSDQAGFTWKPVTADDIQYLVPSCQCGYAANKPIVDKAQVGAYGYKCVPIIFLKDGNFQSSNAFRLSGRLYKAKVTSLPDRFIENPIYCSR